MRSKRLSKAIPIDELMGSETLSDDKPNAIADPPKVNDKSLEELDAASGVKGMKKAEPREGNHDYMRRITGSSSDALILPYLLISETRELLAHIGFPKEEDKLVAAKDMLEEIHPQNTLECMLAVQMIGVHHTAIALLKSANTSQSLEVSDSRLGQAARLMRLFNEQLEAMARLKGKTRQQKVLVEHVHVNAGGKAIVGAVTAGDMSRGEGVDFENA